MLRDWARKAMMIRIENLWNENIENIYVWEMKLKYEYDWYKDNLNHKKN